MYDSGGSERSWMDKKYTLKKHPLYGFFQIAPTPGREEINAYYAKEFYSSQYVQCNDSHIDVQDKEKSFYQGHFDDVLHALEEVGQRPLSGMSLLDIGCGWGQALVHFRRQGVVCTGIDPATEAVRFVRDLGFEVFESDIDDLTIFKDRKFDVVCLLNVLEHVTDPVRVLRAIHSNLLMENGLLVVEVPNEFNPFQMCADECLHLDRWWVAPPAHLNYFSVESLSRFMEGNGFLPCVKQASFPLEMFLLFGENYVKKARRGKFCHQRRMEFEHRLRSTGRSDVLRKFYRSLAEQNLGRQITIVARRIEPLVGSLPSGSK